MKRVLVAGDLKGDFVGLAQKINGFINKSQHFDFAVCVGQTLSLEFPLSDYINANVKMPIPVYFIDCSEISQSLNHLYPTGHEIINNIYFLGRSGIQNIQGLEIAFINGVHSSKFSEFYLEDQCQKLSFSGPYYTGNDIKLIEEEIKRKSNFLGVDIFISNEWPDGFDRHTNYKEPIKNKSNSITNLVSILSPKYHFCAMENRYYARFPYRNSHGHLSRLVCIASWKSLEKHICAFQINPLIQTSFEELRLITDDSTLNPYESSVIARKSKDPFLNVQEEIEKEIMDEENLKQISLKKQNNTDSLIKSQGSEIIPSNFSKSLKLKENTQLRFSGFDYRTNDDDIIEFLSRWGKISKINIVYDEGSKKHKGYGFIEYKDVSITELALEESEKYSLHSRRIKFAVQNQSKQHKNDECWFCYSNSKLDKSLIFFEGVHCYLALDKGPISKGHLMIIPFDHLSSSLEFTKELNEEIFWIKKNLLTIFERRYNQGFIIYERYIKLSSNISHVLLNCIPLDLSQITTFYNQFEQVVKKQKIDFFPLKDNEDIQSCVQMNEFFFSFEIKYNNNINKRYLYVFKETDRFPTDFGRQIICEILNIPERLNWKLCSVSEKQLSEQIDEMKFNILKFK